jgi:hypothetical protein
VGDRCCRSAGDAGCRIRRLPDPSHKAGRDVALLKPQCPRALPAKAVIIEITRQIRLALTSAL